jgi:hypothetical protein
VQRRLRSARTARVRPQTKANLQRAWGG